MSRKKQNHEEEGGAERWLVSYADFITLLFAFFTTLYAISNIDAQKAGKMVMSMRASFDGNLFPSGSNSLMINPGAAGNGFSAASIEILKSIDVKKAADGKSQLKRLADLKGASGKKEVLNGEKEMGRLKRTVDSLLSKEINKGKVQAHVEARGLIISMGENGVFDSGSDQIKQEGKELLDTIATSLVSVANQIRIEGHTDNIPIKNSKFPSNWELSTARATSVIAYLISKFGMSPELISAAGYAEYRPASANDTVEGRARNRRVDIVVLNPMFANLEPK